MLVGDLCLIVFCLLRGFFLFILFKFRKKFFGSNKCKRSGLVIKYRFFGLNIG